MSIKDKAVKILEDRYPLVSHRLDQCELEPEVNGSGNHMTIHLHAPSLYILEQLECEAIWPKVYQAIMEVIGKDFTLNFVRDQKVVQLNRSRRLQSLLYQEVIRRVEELIQYSSDEKDDSGTTVCLMQEKLFLESIKRRVDQGESIWLSDLIVNNESEDDEGPGSASLFPTFPKGESNQAS